MVQRGVGVGVIAGWWRKIRATDMRGQYRQSFAEETHQLSERAERAFSLLPAAAQDVRRDVLGLQSAGSAVSAPRLAGNQGGPSRVVRGVEVSAIEKAERVRAALATDPAAIGCASSQVTNPDTC